MTNIQHDGECHDCKHLQKKINSLEFKLYQSHGENARLKYENDKLVEALKDVIHHHIEFGGLHNDIQNRMINILKEIES